MALGGKRREETQGAATRRAKRTGVICPTNIFIQYNIVIDRSERSERTDRDRVPHRPESPRPLASSTLNGYTIQCYSLFPLLHSVVVSRARLMPIYVSGVGKRSESDTVIRRSVDTLSQSH